jgi:hypothetical protein
MWSNFSDASFIVSRALQFWKIQPYRRISQEARMTSTTEWKHAFQFLTTPTFWTRSFSFLIPHLIWKLIITSINTVQFKKKVTLSHVYNEVTSEPTITRYASIVRKALKVLIWYLTNTHCGNPVSHGTRQSDSPSLSRLSPACPCLWLPQRRWCAISILKDHLVGVVFLAGGSIPKRVRNSRCTLVTELVFANCRIQNAFCCGVTILQHGLPWRRPETLPRVNYKQTLRAFLTIDVYRVIVDSMGTSL